MIAQSATTNVVGEPENHAARLAKKVKNLFIACCTLPLTPMPRQKSACHIVQERQFDNVRWI
jgi:hypothetical protein